MRKDHWKLVFPHSYISFKHNLPGQEGWPGPTTIMESDYVLYNLRTDPGETLDIKELFPDVVRELETLAEKYREELGDQLTGREGNQKRPPAKLK